jgi:hypothetical protein
MVECFLVRQQCQQAASLTPVTSLKSSKQPPIGFGNCQQRTLADIVGQLIYPLEIVENPIASYVGQGLDGGLEAGIQFGGCRIPVEACRESDITLLK